MRQSNRSFATVVRVLVLCALFAYGLTGSAQAMGDDMTLLEVHVRGQSLSDVLITAYAGEGDVFVPVGALFDILGLEPEDDGRGAAGESGVLLHDDEMYVASEQWRERYAIDVDVDTGAAVLFVDSERPLPLFERMQREGRWQRLTGAVLSSGAPADARPPSGDEGGGEPSLRPEQPYALFELNALDYRAQFEAVSRPRRSIPDEADLTLRLSAAGELLFMTALLDMDVDKHGAEPKRFTLQRVEPDPILLGPLGARQVALGDTVHPGLSLVTPATLGTGVYVSNAPPTRAAAFDRIVLAGELPDGWDVELYRNDVLIDYRRADGSGKYTFDDVVLYYGDNELRLVFYGPRGEEFVEEHSYPVSELLIPEGEAYYELSGGADAHGRQRAIGRYGRALGGNVSADVGVALVPVGEDEATFASVGVQALGSSSFVQVQAAADGEGGRALNFDWRTRWRNTHIAASQLFLSDFESATFRPRLDPLVARTTVSLHGALRSRSGARRPTGLDVVYSATESGREGWQATHRIGAFVGGVGVTNWLTWTGGDRTTSSDVQGRSLGGRFVLNRRRGGSAVAYEVGYGLYPEARVETLAFNVEHSLPLGARLRVGLGHSLLTSDVQFTAGVQQDIAGVTFGVHAGYDARGEYRFGVSAATGAVRKPAPSSEKAARFVPAPQGVARGGSAAVTVFLDDNGNGVFDAGERPLEGVPVLVDGIAHGTRTGPDGTALLTGLPVHEDIAFAIGEVDLPDIFWSASGDGVAAVLRPGHVAEIQLPVVVRGEVFGTTYLDDGDGTDPVAVSGVELRLIDEEGNAVAETVSGYDGFYLFDDVLPGHYVVALHPDQGDRLGLVQMPQRGREVVVSPGAVSVDDEGPEDGGGDRNRSNVHDGHDVLLRLGGR